MPTPHDPQPLLRLFAPLAPAAIAMAVGVVADRFAVDVSTRAWAVVVIVAGLVALRRPHPFVLLVAFAAVGGARHHSAWSDLAADDIAVGDWSAPSPAWLRGAIVDGPHHFASNSPGQEDGATRIVLDVAAITDDGVRWRPASGRVLVHISGDRSDLQSGDPVFAAGTLGTIPGPKNPGEPDRRDRARAEGIRLRMSVGDASSIWPDPDGTPSLAARWIGRTRARSQALLTSGLPADVSALAAALLLGRREAVDPDLNDAFARTGTTHLLAISGLHLQALAWVVLSLLLGLGIGCKKAYAFVAVATVAYGLLVGFAPSVTRSVAMTLLVCAASRTDARPSLANCLSFAAVLTMMFSPSSLFDAGCQLSFLAVMVLFWAVPAILPAARPMTPDTYSTPKGRLDALERLFEPRSKSYRRKVKRKLVEALAASVVIWVLAIPLVAYRFHLISPIGVLLNVPLIPITTLALLCAGFTLAASLVWPPLAWPSSWVCGWLLRWTMWFVNLGAATPGGWSFTPGPSLFATLAFYAILASAGWATYRGWRSRKAWWSALAAWSALMVAMVLIPAKPDAPEVVVLAVDHGLAVVIQGTDGRVTLYDCGKMRDPRVGRRIIAPALWSRGVSRIETVILSHADSDHYDALPDLIDRFAIGEVRVPPGFGGSKNPEAVRLIVVVRAHGIPIREIARGDTLPLAGGRIEVLHPPRDWSHGIPDNARSVVLNVTAPGSEGVLLTGDLEGPGLAELAGAPRPSGATTMLAPHHGGRSANPAWFYDWAAPRRVIASQKTPSSTSRDALAPIADRGVAVDRTWQTGAVAIRLEDPLNPAPRRESGIFAPLGMKAGRTILGAALGLILCALLAVTEWGAWTLVMPGRRLAHREPEPPPWEPIDVQAKDGARLHGARLRNQLPSRGTITFLHGFGEDRAAMRGRAESMHRRGWTVAVLDTRGRGRSEGDRTSFGGREADDLHAWLDVLEEVEGPIVAWGRSMGAAIAARAAVEDVRIAAVILEAPYADLRNAVGAWIARMHLPRSLAVPILWRAEHLAGVSLHEPRPIDVAKKVSVPAFILYGSIDPVALPAEVQRLAKAFAGKVQLVEVEGARHGDVFERGGESLAEWIATWAEQAQPR